MSDAHLSRTASEQTVMLDAVEAMRQDVEQETADELVDRERHDPLPIAAVTAVILVAEGDVRFVERDQTTVRDGDPVGIAQIGKHCLRPRKGRLGIDDPAFPADWRQYLTNARRSTRGAAEPKNASCPASCNRSSRVRNKRRKSLPSTRTGRRNAGRDDIQRDPSRAMPPPRTIMWTCGWWVMAEPQVWSTAVIPMRAPRCFLSAAIVSIVSDAE